jgi:Sec-independent protein translocase protein TatA
MAKTVWIAAIAVAMILTVGKAESLAQFGRGLGGIFGGARGGRGGENRQNQNSQVNRLVPDSYQETQHNLMMMKTDLQLTPEQEAPWSTFSDKVMVYASELSMERARIGISESQRTAVTGLQYVDQATAGARTRVTELEDIRNAANVLYGTFTSDQKKIADARMASVISPQPDAQGGGTPPHYP